MGIFDWLTGAKKAPPPSPSLLPPTQISTDFRAGAWMVVSDRAPPPFRGARHSLGGIVEGTENTLGLTCVSWGVQCLVCLDHFASHFPVVPIDVFFEDGVFIRFDGGSQRQGQHTIAIAEFWPLIEKIKTSAPFGEVGIEIDGSQRIAFSLDGFHQAYQEWRKRVLEDFPNALVDER